MLNRNLLLCGIFLMFYGISTGQNIRGVVTTHEDIILPGAQVWLAGYEQTAVFTNEMGDYQIRWPEGADSLMLLVNYVGYRMDTTLITGGGYYHIRLAPMDVLSTVMVADRRAGQYLSNLTPIKTEVISSAELAKGACCDLAGCFNTNGSVQAAVTNVVTNTKELRILGLGGVYNQILLDGFPMILGSSYTYGMSTLPGPFIENIFISKGANSVLQGWEGISGQVNVETKDPGHSPRYFGNMYINSFGEKQFNAFTTFGNEKVKICWRSMWCGLPTR
jgi:outer membrane receptor for ferrienterochelin and colicins